MRGPPTGEPRVNITITIASPGNRGRPAPDILDRVTSPSLRRRFDAPFDGDLRDDLALALRLADAADAASMARFDAPDLDVQHEGRRDRT